MSSIAGSVPGLMQNELRAISMLPLFSIPKVILARTASDHFWCPKLIDQQEDKITSWLTHSEDTANGPFGVIHKCDISQRRQMKVSVMTLSSCYVRASFRRPCVMILDGWTALDRACEAFVCVWWRRNVDRPDASVDWQRNEMKRPNTCSWPI